MALMLVLRKLLLGGIIRMKRYPLFVLFIGAVIIGDSPTQALSARQQYDLCRSVMENRPYNPAKDGPYPKPTNSIGYGAYPPPEQRGIWIDLKCWEMPGIYDPF